MSVNMKKIIEMLPYCPFCYEKGLVERYDHIQHEAIVFCEECKGEIRLRPKKTALNTRPGEVKE